MEPLKSDFAIGIKNEILYILLDLFSNDTPLILSHGKEAG